MSEPLRRNLLKKNTDFHWSPSQSTAFEKIKQSMCREVSLTYFDPEKKTVVQVDASLRGLGSVLVQEGKVVAFASLEMIHLKNLTATPPRLQRMLLRIQGHDLTISTNLAQECFLLTQCQGSSPYRVKSHWTYRMCV